ncbi:MAG: PH domain-containing protein [Actinomycetes bacterium]
MQQYPGADQTSDAALGGVPVRATFDSPPPAFVPDPALDGPPDAATEPFAPPSDAWRRVSPRLARVRRITLSLWLAGLFLPVAAVGWFLVPDLRWVSAAIVAVGFTLWLFLFLRAPRVVARYGWARRDQDLCFVRGLWFRQLTVVPFGRMQVVRVTSGPLLRAHGLATVELVTASAATDVTIPGLPGDEARALRDLIIELTDAQGSGL